MVIDVKPDPAHPRGGYAELSWPETDLAGETTEVSVFDNYSERYLGAAGWQPTKAFFGPYKVQRDGARARVVIGPEIVNQIVEYANVRLSVGPVVADVGWPDDVVPAPGAARIGGILSTSSTAEKTPPPRPEPALTAEHPSAPPPSTAPTTKSTPTPPTDPLEQTRSGKYAWVLAAAVLLAGAAGAAYWYTQQAAPVDPDVVAEPVDPDPNPCAGAALQALGSFAAQLDGLRSCGGGVSADTALRLVEAAAATGDAEALLLFGTVYDAMVTTPVIEDEIGFTFEDTPATAAEYYARSKAAGSEEAGQRLDALCERMATMTDTLTAGARADYCGD